jgi:hypothetical protein
VKVGRGFRTTQNDSEIRIKKGKCIMSEKNRPRLGQKTQRLKAGAQSISKFEHRQRLTGFKVSIIIGMSLVIVLLAGCSQAGNQPTLDTPEVTLVPATVAPSVDEGNPTQTSEGDQVMVDSALEPYIQEAQEDLAQRLNISADEIEVIEAKAVVWPDAGLGCPQPGMAYAQVQVEGILIRLSFQGMPYDYHGGGSQGLFLCELTDK